MAEWQNAHAGGRNKEYFPLSAEPGWGCVRNRSEGYEMGGHDPNGARLYHVSNWPEGYGRPGDL